MLRAEPALVLALALTGLTPAQADDFREFDSRGLPGSQGIVVRMRHPAAWRKVKTDDEIALAELRGPEGKLTGILQVARGRRQAGAEALCAPERARTMLQQLEASDARVTDVVSRSHDGRPGFEIRYERSNAPGFLLVRSVIVCLRDSRLLVSCGATGDTRAALAGIEPVCEQVLESLRISEQ